MATTSKPELTTPFVDGLVELSFAVQGVLSRVAAEHGLSVTQLRLLGMLRDRRPTMAAIATHLDLDRSSVSGLIDRAEARQLVAREPSPTDARVTHVRVTDAGIALGRQIAAAVSARLDELTAGVSATDRDRLVRLARLVVGDPGAHVLGRRRASARVDAT